MQMGRKLAADHKMPVLASSQTAAQRVATRTFVSVREPMLDDTVTACNYYRAL